jgi:hypothetical protein
LYIPLVPNLTQAWTRAGASKPHGWTLRGVVLGPREVDPAQTALADLANKLAPIRGNRNG